MQDIVTQPYPLLLVALIGLLAGVLGGMLGIGGSMIMIPGLVIVFGQGIRPGFNQHAYQAAAMIANVAVAVPAALRHHRARMIQTNILRVMLPAAALAVIAGVLLSNLPVFRGDEGGVWLGRLLALFLVYEIIFNIRKIMVGGEDVVQHPMQAARVTRPRIVVAGTSMGLIAGLLGVGGGIIAVPLQQILLGLQLRAAIANSAAVMVASSAMGAVVKNWTLPMNDVPWYGGLLLAAMLAPTCIIGGRFGASLTHRLPIRQVRVAFIILMGVAAYRLAGLPWPIKS